MLRAWEVKASILDGATPLSALSCGTSVQCVASGARLDAPGALAQAELWASAPQLVLADLTVSDLDGGDADGVLERGESAELRVAVLNDGHAVAGDVVLSLTVAHPHATIEVGSIDVGRIEPYETVRPSAALRLAIDLACDADRSADLGIALRDRSTGEVWGASEVLWVPCNVDADRDGVRYPEDCDDLAAEVFPGADERCNGIDDDCDEVIDEDDAVDAVEWYPDADGDGFGAAGSTRRACSAPEGYGSGSDDCDDSDADVNPDAPEVCDGIDNDCDDGIDVDAVDAAVWYVDGDDDGWGSSVEVRACEQPDGSADNPDDCDDSDADAWPGSETHRADCTERMVILGCACSAGGHPGGWWLGAAVLLIGLRRRRSV
jgi:MYXO-CTERM domain-containing protein